MSSSTARPSRDLEEHPQDRDDSGSSTHRIRIVAPGLFDVLCHLREPGYEYKETIRTADSAAAAADSPP
jgi:dihydroorotase-like cyclic amidohydrolase